MSFVIPKQLQESTIASPLILFTLVGLAAPLPVEKNQGKVFDLVAKWDHIFDQDQSNASKKSVINTSTLQNFPLPSN